jgi:hypothetical protein
MAKKTTLENENVYFPHFVSARHDRKLRRVRKELGVEGYGIFFMLLEVLREQSDLKYPIEDLDLLADEFGTSEQKIRVVICNYNLFKVDKDEYFFSPKQIEYLQPYFAKSNRAKHAALKRWHGDDANALQMHSDSNTNAMQVKESKVKESKVEVRVGSKEEKKEAPAKPLENHLDEIPKSAMTVEQFQQLHENLAKIARLSGGLEGLTPKEIELYIAKRGADEWEKPQGNHIKQIRESNMRHDMRHMKLNGWLREPKAEETENTFNGGVMN